MVENPELLQESSIHATAETRVSTKHPDRNEDAVLGDTARLAKEAKEPPRIKTQDTVKDLEIIRLANEQEAHNAESMHFIGARGVFDGVSGSNEDYEGTGVVASRVTSAEISQALLELSFDDKWTVDAAKKALKEGFERAHQRIASIYHERTKSGIKAVEDAYREMSTTASVCLVQKREDGKYDVVGANAGDSRVLVYDSASGSVKAVSKDDGFAKLFIQRPGDDFEDTPNADVDTTSPAAIKRAKDIERFGRAFKMRLIDEAEYDLIAEAESEEALPPDLQVFYKMRNYVLNAIGAPDAKEVNPDTFSLVLNEGDRVIITTDGVHDNLTTKQIEAIIRSGGGTKELIAAASAVAEGGKEKNARSKKDDITGAVIDLGRVRPYTPPVTEAMRRASKASTAKAKQESINKVIKQIEDMTSEAQIVDEDQKIA